jgi:hypothetical protein
MIIGLDGDISLYSLGIRYQDFGSHAFAFLWDGAYVHNIVDGQDVGQIGSIGENDGRYLLRAGDITGGGFEFGYVRSLGNMDVNGVFDAVGEISTQGFVYAVGDLETQSRVVASGGQVILTQYGIQFGDWGANIFSMRWDGSTVWFGIDNAVWLPLIQPSSGSGFVHSSTINSFEFSAINGPSGYTDYMQMNALDGTLWLFEGTPWSDESLKSNVAPAPPFDSLAAIRQIEFYEFDWEDGRGHVPSGLMYENVNAHLPDATGTAVREADGPEVGFIVNQALIRHLIRAVQQLDERTLPT